MLTRFKTNVARYPRLFKLWLTVCALAVAYYFIPVVFAFRAELALSITLAGLVYLWITLDAGRTQIMLDILDRFEGRKPAAEPCACGFLMSVDHYGDEVRCTLDAGHEGGHLEVIETDVDENYEEEEEIDAT
jgi:hypothetical protein